MVLYLPFYRFYWEVPQEKMMNLVIYSGAILYSTIIAVYYCFIHPQWRIIGARKRSVDAANTLGTAAVG